jgi:hypothetical protein
LKGKAIPERRFLNANQSRIASNSNRETDQQNENEYLEMISILLLTTTVVEAAKYRTTEVRLASTRNSPETV